jgi:hypothetical protein
MIGAPGRRAAPAAALPLVSAVAGLPKRRRRSLAEIRPCVRLSAAETDAIAAEGERLLGFAGRAGAVPDVRFAPVM